jgi:hypothetical protein
VHHHFPPARENDLTRGLDDTAGRAGRGVPRLVREAVHRAGDGDGGPGDVGHQLGRRSAGTGGDVGAPPIEAAGVLVPQLADGGTLQPPDDTVGVARQMREDVADAPLRQEAGPACRAVVEPGQRGVE